MRASQVCYPADWEGRYAEEKADILWFCRTREKCCEFISQVLPLQGPQGSDSVPAVMILSESSSGLIGGLVLWVKAQPRDPYISIEWFGL